MQLRREPNRTPHDMFFESMVRDGFRGVTGFERVDDPVDDLASYGIDWDVAENRTFMNHHLANNADAGGINNPFEVGPPTLSNVPCEPPECPLSADQVRYLDDRLSRSPHRNTSNMVSRCLLWQDALYICNNIYHLV
jgi:hypothetical protein